MATKTGKVKMLIKSSKWKEALTILCSFRLEFTKSQKRLIEISADVMNGHGNFYRQLGIDVEQVVNETKAMLTEKYCKI